MSKIKPLAYSYDALEPFIDEATMRVHHDKHHQGYFDKFKAAVEANPELKELSAEEVLWQLEDLKKDLPEATYLALKNNGGGYIHHNVFWEIMSPDGVREPQGELREMIRGMGGFDKFKQAFTQLALKQFGSGWAWLVLDENKNLQMYSLPNQDSPLSLHHQPILAVDVWEHAYYLKYQNKRAEYLENWWQVVDFAAAEKRYQAALKQ